jgi:anti-sigma regulatory factor (Ser/Thr protein kinase)
VNFSYQVTKEDFSSAGDASSNFKRTLKKIGIPSNIIRKIAIAMYEAEINMVIHADGGVIEAEVLPEQVVVRLIDKGPGIEDIDLAMKEGFSTATDEIRNLGFGAGMGLPNMKRNSDFLKVNSVVGEGTTVEIIVNLV